MDPHGLLPCVGPVAALLPRTWSEWLADRTADAVGRWSPGTAQCVQRNLEQVLGRTVTTSTPRHVLRSYARYYLCMLRLAHLGPERAFGPLRVEGTLGLDNSLSCGRGALVLSAHLGNWDAVGAVLGARFGRVSVFVEDLRPARLWTFYARARARYGGHAVPAGRPGRTVFEELRRNGVMGLVADRVFGTRSVRVVCGQGYLCVPTGGIRLALRSGAAVHTGFAVRADRGWHVRFGPDLTPRAPLSLESSVRHVAERYAEALHETVRQVPDQWCLLYPADPLVQDLEVERGAA